MTVLWLSGGWRWTVKVVAKGQTKIKEAALLLSVTISIQEPLNGVTLTLGKL